jgi:predicted GH43/DUF377 family glycosyl hydrolase
VGVLNPTYVEIEGTRRLIVRVDERPIATDQPGGAHAVDVRPLTVARIKTESDRRIELVDVEVPRAFDPDKEPFLPESVREASAANGSELLLSYVSHLRFANFQGNGLVIEDIPAACPDDVLTQYGCEDPRATIVEGRPVVTYTTISRYGSTSWIARIDGGAGLREKRLILGPDHKHSALFPLRVENCYCMLVRPLGRIYVKANGIWLVRSPDLVHELLSKVVDGVVIRRRLSRVFLRR